MTEAIKTSELPEHEKQDRREPSVGISTSTLPEHEETLRKKSGGISTDMLDPNRRGVPLERIQQEGETVSVAPKNNLLRKLIGDGAWAGRRCFIVGGGPSASKFPVKTLEGELVITVNRAFALVPGAAINVSIDTRFYTWLKSGKLDDGALQKWDSFGGAKCWFSYPSEGFTDPDVLEVERFETKTVGECSINDGMGPTRDSGLAALQLAVALGASPIYLIGFDMGGGTKKQKHWHSPYPIQADESIYEYKFMPTWRDFGELWPGDGTHDGKDMLTEGNALGPEIINLNPASRLDVYPKPKGLKITTGPSRPVVVGFYTRSTPYEALAKRMKRSAALYGLQVHLECVDSQGSWEKNVRLKPTAILKALRAYERVVYTDADHVFRRYPEYFDDLDCDFAYPVLDWDQNERRKSGKEILSGTLYFRRTEGTIALLEEWEAECEAAEGRDAVDGVILQERLILPGRLDELGIKAEVMPIEYCHIGKFSAGDPVIEAGQVSRKLRGIIDGEGA